MNENRFLEEGFDDFLQQLIDEDKCNDSKEEGIVKLCIDEGYSNLSSRQKYVLKGLISHYYQEECTGCGDMPWSEILYSYDISGGMCSYCYSKYEKIMNE